MSKVIHNVIGILLIKENSGYTADSKSGYASSKHK